MLVVVKQEYAPFFHWPEPQGEAPTVGETLYAEVVSQRWPGTESWAARANKIVPILVDGPKKHGDPDVGPLRARGAWAKLGVKGSSIVEYPPAADDPVDQPPRLTIVMGALIQSFPPEWEIPGKKAAAWRQVGNAFSLPVVRALGTSISNALNKNTAQVLIQEVIAV